MTDISFSMNFGAPRHVKSLDGHYEVVPHPMPWQQAQQYCAQNDYDLASLHSSQEQQFAADQCARFTQATTAVTSSACVHQLANGDVNIASTTWISDNEEWVFVGCFVSDVDGGSHGDPWPDTGSNWKDLNWEGCRQAARAAGYNTFVMEHPAGALSFRRLRLHLALCTDSCVLLCCRLRRSRTCKLRTHGDYCPR